MQRDMLFKIAAIGQRRSNKNSTSSYNVRGGKTYDAGLRIAKKHNPLITNISSVSAGWNLLLRVIIESGHDIGQELARLFAEEVDVVRTNTIVSFPIFDPADIYFNEDGDL